MLEQNIFMETVREVSEIIRTSATPLTREEILSYFSDMDLNEEQQETVFTYLITPHEEPSPEQTEPSEAAEDETAAEGMEQKEEETAEASLPESKMFQMYLEEIHAVPEYSGEEFNNMYGRLLEGESEVIKPLADAWLRKVLTLAQKLAIGTENFEDIVQEGNMSLFLTLTRLCGMGQGIDVEQELIASVEQAMQAYISEFAGESDSENAIVGKINLVNEAKKYLLEEKGTEPTAEELADYTRLSKEELADILALIEQAKNKPQDER